MKAKYLTTIFSLILALSLPSLAQAQAPEIATSEQEWTSRAWTLGSVGGI